jgi:crotonobetainyl-CoA:carnitine CoA-transferase CaiB-like acyl-CoA transferase
MTSALDGIIVLDLTSDPAGALATMFLCDHGARVIRVIDVHDTAARRGGYLVWDRGKECVRLDFSRLAPLAPTAQEEPMASYTRLLRAADVLVEDFPPSSTQQAMVPFDRLSALNPRLVHCSITAYGKHGPHTDELPIDDLVLARMGILATQPGFRPAPVHVVHPLPSVGAALFAAQGIAAALLAREKTGHGRSVDTSLMAGAMLYHPKLTGENLAPNTFQTHPAGSAPFYSVYECGDGNWVQLGCVHRGFVAIAATVMDIKYVLDEPRFGGGRMPPTEEADKELRAIVAQALRTKPYAEWAKIFEAADVPFAQARLTEESFTDPQVKANGMVVELQDPEVGPMMQMGVPIELSHTPGVVKGPRQLATADLSQLLADLPEVPPATQSPAQPDTLFDPPLKGIRVLEITNLIAGPTAGRLLADLGADVIKMEPLEGDMSRPIGRTYFFNLNTNKRSLSVNTKTPEGKDVAQKLAATADVLLANLRPGATSRMGLGPDINPRLIETHITGYGAKGPYAHRPGIDPLAQALMGLERAQGGMGNPPSFPAQLAPTDFTAGAMGALGTILALYVRERTGVIQRVDTNLLNGGIVLSSEWFTRYQGRPVRRLADKGQYGLDPFHRLYQVNDGWIYVVAESPDERRAFARAFDCPALVDDTANVPAGQHPNDTPLAQSVAQRFVALSRQESLERLRAAGIPCGPVLAGDSEVFLDDPHAAANDMIATQQHPIMGHMRIARHYVRFGHTQVVAGRPTPLLGEQLREVLEELGFSAQTIGEFYEKQAVKTETPVT